MLNSPPAKVQLLVVVFAQFAGTSLWFAGNAILPELQALLKDAELTGWITSAVQIGFITIIVMSGLRFACIGDDPAFRASSAWNHGRVSLTSDITLQNQ